MKYGDSLRQHSVPEWAYYNVDYEAVKHLIKECTSAGKGKAIAIPGQDENGQVIDEKRLYSVLLSEHERVALFVKSKSNEVQGRLGNLERTVRKLRSRNANTVSDAPRPYLLGRYGKLEREAISTGEEIRALSRFIIAQRTAFRKLLKKYKKWSGSNSLEERFRSEVLDRPTSFTNISMSETFDRWTALLQIVRAARLSGGSVDLPFLNTNTNTTRAPSHEPHARSSLQSSASVARKLDQAVNTMNDINFDTAFSEVPVGDTGSRAVYWVHPEQLIELQVLLLQQMRLHLTKQTMDASSSFSQSPIVSRRSSVSTRHDGFVERESDSGAIYLDNADDFGVRQSRATVSESEDSLTCAAAAARWTSSTDDATLALRAQGPSSRPGLSRVRRRHLGALLDAERDFKPWKTSGKATSIDGDVTSSAQDTMSPDEARSVLESNRRLEPLVAILSKRTRFLGLANSPPSGQWALLDTQICFDKVTRDALAGKDWTANLSRDATEFPFAVLRVRREGRVSKDIIDMLDKSHLTERVRGFSLASHAIYECWKPRSMSPPFWLPALSKDIRKVPKDVSLGRRKSSQITVIEQGQNSSTSSNSDNERSASSTALADSSATSVPTTPMQERDFSGLDSIAEAKPVKKVTIDARAFEKPSRKKRREETRYWNEYDYPSDDDANAYYIYIDPEKEDKWFGQQTAEMLYAKFNSLFSGDKNTVLDEERALIRPLTEDEDDGHLSSPTDSDSGSPVKTSFFSRIRGGESKSYGTIDRRPPTSQIQRPDTQLFDLMLPPVETAPSPSTSSRRLIAALSLGASAIICVLEIILAATGRKAKRGEVDVGVLIGSVASLFFALVAVTSVLTVKDRIGLLNWMVIGIVFGAVCVADGMLLGWVLV